LSLILLVLGHVTKTLH